MSSSKIYRRVECGKYEVPSEAFELERDIATLRLMEKILNEVSERSISDMQESGAKTKWNLSQEIRRCRRVAEAQRRQFLK